MDAVATALKEQKSEGHRDYPGDLHTRLKAAHAKQDALAAQRTAQRALADIPYPSMIGEDVSLTSRRIFADHDGGLSDWSKGHWSSANEPY